MGESFRRVSFKRKDGRKEEFALFGLKEDKKEQLLKQAKRMPVKSYLEPIMPGAVVKIIPEPKPAINLSELPTIYYLVFGMMPRAFYNKEDPVFEKRKAIIEKIRKLFVTAGLNIKVELGGSRAVAFRKLVKLDALKDAMTYLRIEPVDLVAVIDATEVAMNVQDIIYDERITVVNIGTQTDSFSNVTIQRNILQGILARWLY